MSYRLVLRVYFLMCSDEPSTRMRTHSMLSTDFLKEMNAESVMVETGAIMSGLEVIQPSEAPVLSAAEQDANQKASVP